MVFVPVVVLQVVERMVVLVPWFDHHSPVPLSSGLEEFLDAWRDLLVNQVVDVPEVVQRVR